MPRASRANGERIWVAGARRGFFLGAAFRGAGRLEGPVPVEPLLPRALLWERLEARDAERRDGEVFVAMRVSV